MTQEENNLVRDSYHNFQMVQTLKRCSSVRRSLSASEDSLYKSPDTQKNSFRTSHQNLQATQKAGPHSVRLSPCSRMLARSVHRTVSITGCQKTQSSRHVQANNTYRINRALHQRANRQSFVKLVYIISRNGIPAFLIKTAINPCLFLLMRNLSEQFTIYLENFPVIYGA